MFGPKKFWTKTIIDKKTFDLKEKHVVEKNILGLRIQNAFIPKELLGQNFLEDSGSKNIGFKRILSPKEFQVENNLGK